MEEPTKSRSRQLLQAYGQFMRDTMGQGYWANRTRAILAAEDSWIIDDLRYPNELEALGNGAIHIHLATSEEQAISYLQYRGNNPDLAGHISESYQEWLLEKAHLAIDANALDNTFNLVTTLNYIKERIDE